MPDKLFDPDWWLPHESTNLMRCDGGNNYSRQYVLVDRTNPSVFTIYVFDMTDNFTTPTFDP
jgi:hypothetical protein